MMREKAQARPARDMTPRAAPSSVQTSTFAWNDREPGDHMNSFETRRAIARDGAGRPRNFAAVPAFLSDPKRPRPAPIVLQRKLASGRADDPLEHEADRVAEAVVGGRSFAMSMLTGPRAIQRQEAAEKPRDQPTQFPAQEQPKQGQAKDDDIKEKLKKGGLAAAGEVAKFLWDQFSNSEEGKRILSANERDLKPISDFFKDFAATVFGKIALGAAAGGAAGGAFAAAQSGRDARTVPETSPSTGGPAPSAPKDDKYFGLELKWDFVTPPTGVTLKTPWLDSPKIPLGREPPTVTPVAPAPPVLFKTAKIPRICTSSDPKGDNGEADARSAFIFWWLQRNRQIAENRAQELLAGSKLHEPPKNAPSAVKPMFKRESGVETFPDPKAIEAGLRSSGQPLEPTMRAYMEPRFGYDFGDVRIHTNPEAADSARAVAAKAYTVGQDVVFGQGHYAPATCEGKKLIAHELTHVVQQRPHSDASSSSVKDTSSGSTFLRRQPAPPSRQTTRKDLAPRLGPARYDEIESLIQESDFHGAISMLVGFKYMDYEIDFNLLLNKKMYFDSGYTANDAFTSMPSWDFVNNKADPAKVTIGPSAFSSVPYLYSVIMHEYQHVLWQQTLAHQQQSHKDHREGFTAPDEVEAGAWELLHAKETGIANLPNEIAQIWEKLNKFFWQLDDKAQKSERPLVDQAYQKAKELLKAIGSSQSLAPFRQPSR